MNQVAKNWNVGKILSYVVLTLRLFGRLLKKMRFGNSLMPTIIAVNPAVAVGNIKRSLKTAGPSNIKIFVLKFHQPDSSIPDCFLNRQPIGIS